MDIEARINFPDNESMPPLMVAVFAHWRAARDGKALPAWTDYHLDALPSEAVPWCAVVDVISDPLDFKYRFFGTKRWEMQGDEFTGRSVREIQPASFAEKAFGELRTVVERKQPIHVATMCLPPHEDPVHFDVLRLPLGDDGEGVRHVVTFTAGGPNFHKVYGIFGTEVPGHMMRRNGLRR